MVTRAKPLGSLTEPRTQPPRYSLRRNAPRGPVVVQPTYDFDAVLGADIALRAAGVRSYIIVLDSPASEHPHPRSVVGPVDPFPSACPVGGEGVPWGCASGEEGA